MISSEVQRTLVKSPPELWSELSDPAALARHLGELGELGEIRIVRVEPEKTVEWAAEHTTGTVSIQPSGWGTKVTLSVERELVAATPSQAEPESAEPTDTAEPGDVGEPADAAEPTDTLEPIDAAEPQVAEIEPASEESPPPQPAEDLPEPAAAETSASAITAAASEAEGQSPRVGFFARLFRRRRRREEAAETQSETIAPAPAPEPAGAFAAVSEALAQEAMDSHAFTDPPAPAMLAAAPEQSEQAEPSELEHETQAEQSSDIAAELMAAEEVAAEEVAAEEVAAEEVTAVLAAVLDRLGAAHHRPFSRS
jgi:hypothetical protein